MPRPAARRPFATLSALVAFVALTALLPTAPAAAQSTPLPGVGEVGQGIEWTGFLEPTMLHDGEAIVFVARGVVGARPNREIGRLLIAGNLGVIVVGADFRALGDEGVRIVLLDGNVPVADVEAGDVDVIVPEDPISTDPLTAPSARRGPAGGATAAATEPGDVTIGLGGFPGGAGGSVTVALSHRAGFGSASGEVVPAPAFALDLGTRTEEVFGGTSYQATEVLFLARSTFPPPGSPSAILERVEVYTNEPSLDFTAEEVDPGVLFSGVPVTPDEGALGVHFDPLRNAIAAVDLGPPGSNLAFLLTGAAAGVAVAWEAADLVAGAVGSSAELAAIGQNIASVEVRGVVTATRTAAGWDLSFQPPSGLGGVARTIEVDGVPVGTVTVPAPSGVFARAAEPSAGAAVFPIGLGGGAFYGFSWDEPVPITVPGVGTFPGSQVRLTFPQGIGPLAVGGVAGQGLPELTLTGLAAPAEDGGGTCMASSTVLCLTHGRFAVEARWSDPFGGSGAGVVHPLTSDTGAFWFFEPANLELVVKVLDACPVNQRFWVFAGGLTDVEVELTVTDTRSGLVRVYRNPLGQAFQPIHDTAAFATCAP
jgi:hypothetical protein